MAGGGVRRAAPAGDGPPGQPREDKEIASVHRRDGRSSEEGVSPSDLGALEGWLVVVGAGRHGGGRVRDGRRGTGLLGEFSGTSRGRCRRGCRAVVGPAVVGQRSRVGGGVRRREWLGDSFRVAGVGGAGAGADDEPPGAGLADGPAGVVFGAVVVGAPGAEVPRRGGSAPGVGEGVVEVGLVGGASAPGRDAAPVADPDPAVELGAGTPPGPVLGSGVPVGWCAGAPELGEPQLQLAQQWRPAGVIVRVEGGEQRRRNLEFDDRCRRPRARCRPRGPGGRRGRRRASRTCWRRPWSSVSTTRHSPSRWRRASERASPARTVP